MPWIRRDLIKRNFILLDRLKAVINGAIRLFYFHAISGRSRAPILSAEEARVYGQVVIKFLT